MKLEQLEELGPVLGQNDILAFGQRLGFTLPEDYREFLQRTNGGMTPEISGFFYVETMDWWNRVNFFFGIRRPDVVVCELENVLERMYEQHPDCFSVTSGKLPIASDDLGNKIYLWLKGPEKGSVYFWMHDADGPDDKLNSSFGSFFDSLREEPPEIQATLQK